MSLFAALLRPFFRAPATNPGSHLRVGMVILGLCSLALAQRQLPYLDASRNSPLAQVDFDEIYRQQVILDVAEKDRFTGPQAQFESGTVSALDMNAPEKAVRKLRHAMDRLKEQKVKDAVRDLQDAINTYPKFVSAHIVLGLAYFDLKDKRAKDEFETATYLDDQLPTSFLYLGMMSLWTNDFSAADANLEKAAFLSPNDPQILNVLAFAQNGAHKYADVLQTVHRLHRLDHHGMEGVHYVAASAALSLEDVETAKNELRTFLSEDRTGPLSAVARQKLDQLSRGRNSIVETVPAASVVPTDAKVVTFPNTRLKSELNSVAAASDPVDEFSDPPEPASVADGGVQTSTRPAGVNWSSMFTIRKAVDEAAIFLAVSEDGKMVNDLSLSDIKIRDDNRPPERILQFLPQSQLPLRLAVLVDTSGSVEERIGFEKSAAKRFLERVLNPGSDLAFVAGFDTDVLVAQDFTADAKALDQGVDKLVRSGEGTAVFDAVHFACWKLGAYPDQGRVARVLVLLSDGEDNSSHRSLRQALDAAEAAGITVYTINTSQNFDLQTDANHVLRVIGQRSGGESVYPQNMRELEHYFRQLSDAIRSRYLIAYKPANFVPDGSYHRLKISAERDGKHLQVHVRKGYYARMTWSH
jgi:Ca-activated chloride channel homolog